MGHVRFDKNWQYHGRRILRLENDQLRIDILPELGGKIYHWIHKPEDRDYLWQHPRIAPALLPAGTNYDDNFCGGWDELFPCGGPVQHRGESYPDHGEYWTRCFDWDVEQSGGAITLHLWAQGCVTPTRMDRWITLVASSPVVRLRYRLTHLGCHGFDFLWALHPALSVGPTSELLIPGGRGEIAFPGLGRLAPERAEFIWPHVPGRDGRTFDMSRVPPATEAPGFEMVYLTELREGWFAHLDHATGNGFGLAFDTRLFNTLWVFQSFGGWRGLHVAIVEPCTGYPEDLARAASSGRCARLEPGQVIETEAAAVVFTDRRRIEHIFADGTVT